MEQHKKASIARANQNMNKTHKCEICEKLFRRKYYLKQHIHTFHEHHKDNKCEFCGKSFTEAGTLKRHIHTLHNGQKDNN